MDFKQTKKKRKKEKFFNFHYFFSFLHCKKGKNDIRSISYHRLWRLVILYFHDLVKIDMSDICQTYFIFWEKLSEQKKTSDNY